MIQRNLRVIAIVSVSRRPRLDDRRPVRPIEDKPGEWPTYGGDLASTRYSPLDQITKDNFNKLEVAWRFKTDVLGPRPEFNFQGTPLMVDGVVYSTAGTRRAVVALDAGTGEMLWMHSENEGKRGEAAPRQLSGRGLVVLDRPARQSARIVYVTPGYQMVALDAKTGVPAAGFGKNGIVDLKRKTISRSISRPARSACTRRRSSRRTSSSSAPRTCPAARRRAGFTRRASSAATTRAPASGSGSSTRFRSPASSATTRGRKIPGRTPATPASGRR